MDRPLILDAHLDLSMNAMEWNRDLRWSVEDIRLSEMDMNDKPDRAKNTVSLPALREGNVGILVATQIARYVKPGSSMPGWNSQQQAWAQTQAQLAWYRTMEEAGLLTQIIDRESLYAQLSSWDSSDHTKPIGYILSLEGADSIISMSHLGIMTFVGWFVSRKQKGGEAFLLGGRQLSLGLLLGTVVATLVGTGSSIGAVANAYANGWGGALFGIGGGVGIILIVLCFSSMRKHNFVTMTEEIAFYYGANKAVRATVAVILYLASIGWLGAHILGGSYYLSWTSGLDLLTSKIITAVGFGLYVIIGGYLAVVWTDAIQAAILFVGFVLLAIMAVPAAGGFENIRATVSPENLSFLGIEKSGLMPAISLALSISVGTLSAPSYRQRLYTAKNISVVRRGFYISAIAYFLFSTLPVAIGLSANSINPDLTNNNMAFPFMATTILPPLIGTLVLVSGLSASMSSGDSDAVVSVTILLRDIWVVFTGKVPHKDSVVCYSRWGILFSIMLAFSFGILAEDILGYITKMISTLMSGICVAAILGRFWKRATWQGAIAAFISGSVISFIVFASSTLSEYFGNPIIPSLAGAALAHVIVSLASPRNEVSDADALRIINNERRAMDL